MTTVNRQGDEVTTQAETETETVQMSEEVAYLAGVRKIPCDSLDSEKWAQLVMFELKRAKPFFQHIPYFLPLNKCRLECFCFKVELRRDGAGTRIDGWCFQEQFKYPGALPLFLAEIIRTRRAIQTCEVADASKEDLSKKILLTSEGELLCMRCRRDVGANGKLTGIANFFDVRRLNSTNDLAEIITNYPQVGPRTLSAIQTAIGETCKQRMRWIESLQRAEGLVRVILDRIDFNGCYVEKHPWGIR